MTMVNNTVMKRRQRKPDHGHDDVALSLDPSAVALDNSVNGLHVTLSGSGATKRSPFNGATTPFERQRHERITRLFTYVVIGLVMTFVGWQASWRHAIHKYPQLSALQQVPDPAWWLEETTDDFFTRTYSGGYAQLSSLRKLNNSNFFTGMCGRYRFDTSLMPSVSVIVTVQNEQPGMLTLTVHSVLGRTPPELLRDIVIVDDNGLDDFSDDDPAARHRSVNDSELAALQQLSDKLVIVTNANREGVARSRMHGARKATGDVLVFIDSHVEMLSATWVQHLLIPIMDNPRTVAAQTLDIINDLDWKYGPGAGDLLYGVITDDFWFAYQRSRFGGTDDNGAERERPGRREPYETPFSAGSLFAIRRDRFFEVGGYDEGMYVWGGENTDFAIKTWVCGGRLVMVPCSRVGHMYRIHIRNTGRWPPKISPILSEALRLGDGVGEYLVRGSRADNFTKIISRNNIRVLERWAKQSSARTGYYQVAFGNKSLPPEWQRFADEMEHDPYAVRQRDVIKHLGCKDFRWFDKHVYVKLTGVHHPWHPKSVGRRTWV